MELKKSSLTEAVQRGILEEKQADALWAFLAERGKDSPRFNFTHILYYLGGMMAISAMSSFMTLGWESFGGWGLFFIALAYAGVALKLTEYFLCKKQLMIPAGIMAAFVVTLIPLAVYGLQVAWGYWPDGEAFREYHRVIDWRWLLMELATLAVGVVMLWRYRLPFMMMPVAVTLWYMSMDLTPFLIGVEDASWELRKLVSLFFGLLILLLAFWVELRSRQEKDYAFWLYLFGALAFWGGLSLMSSDTELGKFFYLCINLVMIAISALLSRKVFAVFGALGVSYYLGYLAYDVFKDSMLFPFALTAIGLGVIYMGILWQRHEQSITTSMRAALPTELRNLLDRRQS